MKQVEVGPTIEELVRRIPPERLAALLTDDALRPLVDRANSEYMPWEKFRYQTLPLGVSLDEAWFAVRSSRAGNRRLLPLKDPAGRAFTYWLPEPMWAHIHRVDTYAGKRLGEEMPEVLQVHKTRYLISSLMEEAIASSQLEGASTTRALAKQMLRSQRPPRTRAERMILNNYRTILRVKEFLNEPLSVGMLCELQRLITLDTLEEASACGRLRTPAEDDIGVYAHDNTLVHQPPPAAALPERLETLCAYANRPIEQTGDRFEHPMVRAILLHFWLGYEHPFADGNGRTARALFLWFMLKCGYWLFELLPVSRIIRKSPAQYGRSYLLSELDGRDATYFIAYHLRAISLAVDDLFTYLRAKQEKMNALLQAPGARAPLNPRQRALVVHAVKHPGFVYTVVSHRTSQGVSVQTARSDLLDLARKALLARKRDGKRDVWVVPPDIAERLRRLTAPRRIIVRRLVPPKGRA